MNERKGIGVMQNVQPEIRIHVFHTGRVCVSPGLRQLKEAKHILVSEEEWQDTKAHAERYVTSMWKGVNVETFAFSETGQGPAGRSFDLFGDGSVEMIQIPGHTSGLAAVKITHGGKFVLLFADGGYAEKSLSVCA